MLTRPNLPCELWTSIIDILADAVDLVDPNLFGTSEDTKDLQALSLVCKSMVPLCRKHIFSTLAINTHTEGSGLSHRFQFLLIRNPSLISYTQYLNYQKSNSEEEPHNTVILEALKSYSAVRLQRIDLRLSGMKWNILPSSMRSALEHLIRLPKVSVLNLAEIDGVPHNLFSGCTANVSRISFEQITFDLTVTCPTTTLKPIHLHVAEGAYSAVQSLMVPDPDRRQEILDFTALKEVSFYIIESGEKEIAWKVLQITSDIEYLELQTMSGSTILWTGLGATLTHSHVIHTLRKLNITTTVISNDSDPLRGLVAELKMTAGVNRFEDIEFEVDFDSIPVHAEDWDAFDNLLATRISFPRLVYVYIEWNTPTSHRDPGEVQVLKAAMFQSLKSSKAVELRFEVIEY